MPSKGSFVHQRFQLGAAFAAELACVIEAGLQNGDRLSLIGEDEIVAAGFTVGRVQIEFAPRPFVGLIRVCGIVQVAVICKVRHQIGELAVVVIGLIVTVLEDPDAQSVFGIGVRVKFDPFVNDA